MQRIAAATARATTFTEVVATVLDDVCAHTGWPVGHALVREPSGPLRTSTLWHLDDPTRYQRG